jgi:hypothetical protein
MTHDQAEEFLRDWGDWAKWSDARAMVQEAYSRGYADGAKTAQQEKAQPAEAPSLTAEQDDRPLYDAVIDGVKGPEHG